MSARTAISRLVALRQGVIATSSRSVIHPTAVIQARRCVSSSAFQYEQQQDSAVASTSEQTPPPADSHPSPFEPARTHPRTHNHHVASLQLRANGPGETLENLQLFCDFALRAGYALNIPLSKPASLPTRTSLWTVIKGPFVHKKSQENFERRVHKRVIKVWDADVAVVERWLHFLRVHCMDGVTMRAEIYRHFPLSIGSTLLAASTSQLRSVPEGASSSDDATVRASDPESDQVVKLAKAIIEEEIAKQDAEDRLLTEQIEQGRSTTEGEQEQEQGDGASPSSEEQTISDKEADKKEQ